LTSLLVCALDLARIGKTSFAIGHSTLSPGPGASTARLWS